MEVRPLREDERDWLAEHLRLSWGSTTLVSGGRAHDGAALPAIVATDGDALTGLATYAIEEGECELVTIEAFERARGTGTALLDAVATVARAGGCARLWLITTNDNLAALRFYQRRGLRLVAVHRGAVDEARKIKPGIPLEGDNGIEIHDEIELELALEG
ncbi:MAG TPA: GNAT family N-acetyltransferase [Solirubrobacteraceae bacterium]|nr:GNAT family N-acetyltransferase [Solirubrobacteraceae bacterium]